MIGPPAAFREQIVDAMAEAVIVSDRDGRIVFWNQGAERMFGYPTAEALGSTLDIIIPEKLRARHWDGYRNAMSTGTTRYDRDLLAVPAIHKDGRRISIEFSLVLLRDREGALTGAAAIIRDVTARWERERASRTGPGT